MSTAYVTCLTDPHCPRSWAAEPVLWRLHAQFGDRVAFTYVMSGYGRVLDDPVHELGAWLEAAAASGMPVDARLWLDQPPTSSHPACLAVCAAGEQGRSAEYLRRARLGVACERRKLDTPDALLGLGREVQGLDVARFAIDLASSATVERFGGDLERARAVRDPPATPVFLVDEADVALDALAAAVAAIAGDPDPAPDPESALRTFGRLATAEIAAACDLPGPRAAAELWRLAAEWRVRAEPVPGGGELWGVAGP